MNISIVLATGNKGKLKEFKELIYSEGIKNVNLFSLEDFDNIPDIKEDGNTFKDNAYKKAAAIFNNTKLLTIADDSGLEVDYLDGAPGVYSARFAGEPKSDENNNEKLLGLLQKIPFDKRTARFKCAISIIDTNNNSYFVEGSCEGYISKEPRGNNGFGYDPLFYLPQHKKTMAQLSAEEKNKISHRAQAFEKAAEILKQVLN